MQEVLWLRLASWRCLFESVEKASGAHIKAGLAWHHQLRRRWRGTPWREAEGTLGRGLNPELLGLPAAGRLASRLPLVRDGRRTGNMGFAPEA